MIKWLEQLRDGIVADAALQVGDHVGFLTGSLRECG
jgi:hypothetical protein